MNQTENQVKYGQIKAANFIIDLYNYGLKKIAQKLIQHKMKENLLLLKYL